MAVNQSQVDHIIASASSDDPEVKLLKLQDEVDLIKTSIKRLLIDIRERMNNLENPIVVAGGKGLDGEVASMATVLRDTSSAIESAAGALKTSSQISRPSEASPQKTQEPVPAQVAPAQAVPASVEAPAAPVAPTPVQVPPQQKSAGELDLFSALKSQIAALPREDMGEKAGIGDKVRLQKVFRLFEWTQRNVKRFGHDRVDLMLEAYHAMGYISDQSCKLVKDMTRLMPTSIGELHEIVADEFVSELYELNHILNPSDSTLDRDMIEVLMEKREAKDTRKLLGPARQPEEEEEGKYIQSRDRI